VHAGQYGIGTPFDTTRAGGVTAGIGRSPGAEACADRAGSAPARRCAPE